jgi:hypothetical protein
MADALPDREMIRDAAEELATLARCVNVGVPLEKWSIEADAISGGIAADALDQARGLLDELAGGRARALADAVQRIATTLPPPME